MSLYYCVTCKYLQTYSYPFDWLYGSSFEEKIHILINEFENWMNIEDLEYVGERLEPEPCDIYYNKRTKIIFNHDFPIRQNLKETYKAAKEKYNRRIYRLLNFINKSQSILIVYIEIPETPIEQKLTKNILVNSHSLIKKKYPNKNVDILYIACDLSQEGIDTKIINNSIIQITLNYKSYLPDAENWMVDHKKLKAILKSYRLKHNLACKIKNIFFKLKKQNFMRKLKSSSK